jgi:hypothetical protein
MPARKTGTRAGSATIRDTPQCRHAGLERADGGTDAIAHPGSALARQRWCGMTDDVMHVAERPSWRCRHCHDEWPCTLAKADLKASLDRVGRVIYMNLHLVDVLVDQPQLGAAELFDRFVGWARES